jgi:DNA-binding SARP family transcriptional activator/Flp pilus assembly protein TadD
MAILAFLAAERRPVARDHLALLFWPDVEPSKGKANLRRELHNLAQLFPNCWVSEHQAVAFVPSSGTTVDIYALRDFQGEKRWDEAAALLTGEFLEGLYLEANLEFENWLQAERERWRTLAESILTKAIEAHTQRGRYSEAITMSQRRLQLTPWNENAHCQLMRLLAWTGQRGSALRQFDICKQILWNDLGVEPAVETVALYQQIQDGELGVPPQLPAFLTTEGARHAVSRPSFVGRERELSRMTSYLEGALAGKGKVIFVSGGPGRGKTAQLEEFARRAMGSHPELIAASGSCNAYAGIGDPYLPFRDLMAMLSGDVEARWDAGAITRTHAKRLWNAIPFFLEALLDHAPHLLEVLVSSEALLSRALIAENTDGSSILRLRELIKRRQTRSEEVDQTHLFQEVTDLLSAMAKQRPLLLILDDVQWADAASIGLLFHLGRRIVMERNRVLIVCAYRPEEIAFGRNDERHPLAKTLSEFKRAFGDVWIRLETTEQEEGKAFIDAMLDMEPNRLTDDFRAALFQRTAGHPLFTIELLRALRERGYLQKDDNGLWKEGSSLDWALLPARVEAVIEERIERLDPEQRGLLKVASVEGEQFTAQVVAEAQKRLEMTTLRLLSGELERRHRLVSEQAEIQTKQGILSRYRFGHVLYQEFIYQRLSPGERRLLHGEVARAMEKYYEGRLEHLSVQLGRHFSQAGDNRRALPYITTAAEHAARIHANDEAVGHFSHAIELASNTTFDDTSLANLYRGRGLAYETLGELEGARDDFESALLIVHEAGEKQLECRLLIDLGKLWASKDYQRTRDYFEQALKLSRLMDDPAVVAGSLNWMGNWFANAENPVKASEYHQEALEIFEQIADQRGLAITLDLLGIANLLGGDLSASVGYYDQAIQHFQALDDRLRLVSSLIGRGTIVSLSILLATAAAESPPNAGRDIEKAIQITKEIHWPSEEAWAYWSMGLLHTVNGQFGEALEIIQRGLHIASGLGHCEWEVGNYFALGVLYVELLAPVEAQQQLELALKLAQGLGSQYWINHVSGAISAAYYLLDEPERAQVILQNVISPASPMDTMGKRYCWARMAELALIQGNPDRTLDIIERLIRSAPGASSGTVITFLWLLKAEALIAKEDISPAEFLLEAAKVNALKLNERFLLWRVFACLGQLYGLQNHQNQERESYARAIEHIEKLAMTVSDSSLQESFRRRAFQSLEHRYHFEARHF